MEEQRQRQEDEARRAAVASVAEANISSPVADGEKSRITSIEPKMPISAHFHWVQQTNTRVQTTLHIFLSAPESEDALLKMSVSHADSAGPALPDFSRMTEEEQIAYALQMSMQGAGAGSETSIFVKKKQTKKLTKKIFSFWCNSCLIFNNSFY